MKNSIVEQGEHVTEGLARGVNKLADLVKVTLGPKGMNVIIKKSMGPEIVNDGVTIARSVYLKDPLENMGAQVMKQVSLNTDSAAGDGTTTATILAQMIINKGLELLKGENVNIIVLKKEMEFLTEKICEFLKKQAIQIETDEDIFNIAKISANNDDDIATVIAKAYKEVGRKGYIAVREPKTYEIDLEVVKGMVYDRGYLSKLFVTNRKENKCTLEDCLVALVDGEIKGPEEVLALMELAAENQKGLLIIAEKFKNEALTCLISNKMAGFPVCAINSPGIVSENINYLYDIAAYCGGTVLNENGGKSVFGELTIEDFGHCDSIEVGVETTILTNKNPNAEKISERIKFLEDLKSKTKDQFFLDIYDTRLAKLDGGIAVIFPGGRSDLEIIENKLRTEDAVKAIKSALEMGYLPGGGAALYRSISHMGTYMDASNDLISKEAKMAYEILKETLKAPFEQIVMNCGMDVQAKKMCFADLDFWYGYDAKEDCFVNLKETGIIDPAKVTINALQNAVSVATTTLTTKGCIINIEEEEAPSIFGMR